MNSAANRYLAEGLVTKRLTPFGPSAEKTDRTMTTSNRTVINVASPNSTGREKKIVNSCTWGLVSLEPSLGSYQRAGFARQPRAAVTPPRLLAAARSDAGR